MLFAPLVRARTYRQAVFLVLGGVILLPYLMLAALLTQAFLTESGDRTGLLVITLVTTVLVAIPPFLGGTRELEIAAARSLLGVDLPALARSGPLALETRLRAALWFGVHLAVGAVIGTALLIAVPLALIAFTERLGLTSGGLAGYEVGPLTAEHVWWWTLAGVLLILATLYAVAGLGALARTMAPVLLGPSPAERVAALDARELAIAERNRLARELHDSVGHALTATTLQAGAARAVFDTDPEFARRALAAIEEVGRTAMEDLDHVLGVLRAAEERGWQPVRTLADLDRLGADVRAAGLDLRLSADGVETVTAAVSREGYRIVQEALTNAAKHGGDGPVTVRVTAGPELVIEVRNALSPKRGRPGGRGLAGMRERVMLLGGTLQAGPAGDEWRVRAELPGAGR